MTVSKTTRKRKTKAPAKESNPTPATVETEAVMDAPALSEPSKEAPEVDVPVPQKAAQSVLTKESAMKADALMVESMDPKCCNLVAFGRLIPAEPVKVLVEDLHNAEDMISAALEDKRLKVTLGEKG